MAQKKIAQKTPYEVHDIFMNLDVNNINFLDEEAKALMVKLKRKLSGGRFFNPFWDKKNMEKMREFGENQSIAGLIIEVLRRFEPLPQLKFDMQVLMSLWAVLGYSRNFGAAYFERLTEVVIKRNDFKGMCATAVLIHLFGYHEHLSALNQKLKDYYEREKENLPIYQWAKQLGLSSPTLFEKDEYSWYAGFAIGGKEVTVLFNIESIWCFGSYGVKIRTGERPYFNRAFGIENYDIISEKVDIMSTETTFGVFNDMPFIELSSYKGEDGQDIYFQEHCGIWEGDDDYWDAILDNNRPSSVPISFDLLHIKEFLAELEKRYGFKFDRKKIYSDAKNSDTLVLQRWLAK